MSGASTSTTATSRRMPVGRGPMGQVAPGEKAKTFGPSAKRLLGTLRTDMPQLIVVLAFGVLSVALSVIGPKLLGDATNVVFAGFVSLQTPAGMTKQQVIDQLVASGICSEMKPAKTTVVPSPSSFGPITERVTDRMLNTSTTISCGMSVRSVRRRRFALGPKFCAFSPPAA